MRKSHLDDAIVGGEHHADALCGKRRDRREPRRERVDEEEGDRRQDDRPVPVELALELVRRRVLLVDAARLGDAVELRERGEGEVDGVAQQRARHQVRHELRLAEVPRHQARRRVDPVLVVARQVVPLRRHLLRPPPLDVLLLLRLDALGRELLEGGRRLGHRQWAEVARCQAHRRRQEKIRSSSDGFFLEVAEGERSCDREKETVGFSIKSARSRVAVDARKPTESQRRRRRELPDSFLRPFCVWAVRVSNPPAQTMNPSWRPSEPPRAADVI